MTNASRITCRVLILLASPNLISSEENAITAVLPMAVPVETLCDRRSKNNLPVRSHPPIFLPSPAVFKKKA